MIDSKYIFDLGIFAGDINKYRRRRIGSSGVEMSRAECWENKLDEIMEGELLIE